MVCEVCPLSLHDKSDCGRPQHSGVWLAEPNEEHFTESWDKEGLIIFIVGYERTGVISGMYLLLSWCDEASQDLAGLWPFFSKPGRDGYLKLSTVSELFNEMSRHG